MRILTTLLLWTAVITVTAIRRLTPLAIFIAKDLIFSPRPRLLTPAADPPLAPPAPAGDLSALTRRQLQQIVGTRRNLPKATLLEMAANRPLTS
jgi:hypothetical protein